jgi:hypothetical protein
MPPKKSKKQAAKKLNASQSTRIQEVSIQLTVKQAAALPVPIPEQKKIPVPTQKPVVAP